MTETPTKDNPPRLRPLRVAGKLITILLCLCLTGWTAIATYYSNLPAGPRPAAAALFGLALIALLIFVKPWRRKLPAFFGAFTLILAWWLMIPPSNDRDWQPDVAVLPDAIIEGNKITVHNIRNCDYRSETDFDVHHYDRTYNLDQLRTADLFLVYWGSPSIAHTMISFGFEGGDYLCMSIETRKEKGETYSAVRGFFKQYELTYVLADERDVVRLRTNYRGEDVYLYRLQAKPDVIRAVFLNYLQHVNSLKQKAEWYNALTSNCTTNIRGHARAYTATPWDWRILLKGHLDEMIYENGRLDRSLPFAELKARSHINERGKAADKDPAFSARIREGLPGMEKHP